MPTDDPERSDPQPSQQPDFTAKRLRELVADIPDDWRIMLDIPDVLMIFDARMAPQYLLHVGDGSRVPVDSQLVEEFLNADDDRR